MKAFLCWKKKKKQIFALFLKELDMKLIYQTDFIPLIWVVELIKPNMDSPWLYRGPFLITFRAHFPEKKYRQSFLSNMVKLSLSISKHLHDETTRKFYYTFCEFPAVKYNFPPFSVCSHLHKAYDIKYICGCLILGNFTSLTGAYFLASLWKIQLLPIILILKQDLKI